MLNKNIKMSPCPCPWHGPCHGHGPEPITSVTHHTVTSLTLSLTNVTKPDSRVTTIPTVEPVSVIYSADTGAIWTGGGVNNPHHHDTNSVTSTPS